MRMNKHETDGTDQSCPNFGFGGIVYNHPDSDRFC